MKEAEDDENLKGRRDRTSHDKCHKACVCNEVDDEAPVGLGKR